MITIPFAWLTTQEAGSKEFRRSKKKKKMSEMPTCRPSSLELVARFQNPISHRKLAPVFGILTRSVHNAHIFTR
jgi:hypothetical protein